MIAIPFPNPIKTSGLRPGNRRFPRLPHNFPVSFMANPRFLYPLHGLGQMLRARIFKPSKYSLPTRVGIGCLKLVNLVCFAHLFVEYVGTISTMEGPSMLPTLGNEGEIVVVDRLSTRLDPYNIARGELLILLSPLNPKRYICKRVVGLPGDVVCVDPTGQQAPSTEHVRIPKGHIWIMGDNADASRDSRIYGPVPIGLVQGKLRTRLWPPSKFQMFGSNMTYID
ncbi:peptidase S24/S26A/S26B/S26C [Ephemerocybe angulata]|uniref:Peptidase S24/S26A/S26B/S26C n=1 Tax=Ephemerocybe angulata TaxID=980116 RepID=A0A8H6MHF5_9AGAR|nr:peptidase S24/S26A/S26B/S26C [Tulosesus angulatus]